MQRFYKFSCGVIKAVRGKLFPGQGRLSKLDASLEQQYHELCEQQNFRNYLAEQRLTDQTILNARECKIDIGTVDSRTDDELLFDIKTSDTYLSFLDQRRAITEDKISKDRFKLVQLQYAEERRARMINNLFSGVGGSAGLAAVCFAVYSYIKLKEASHKASELVAERDSQVAEGEQSIETSCFGEESDKSCPDEEITGVHSYNEQDKPGTDSGDADSVAIRSENVQQGHSDQGDKAGCTRDMGTGTLGQEENEQQVGDLVSKPQDASSNSTGDVIPDS